jgi:hypothetical protein
MSRLAAGGACHRTLAAKMGLGSEVKMRIFRWLPCAAVVSVALLVVIWLIPAAASPAQEKGAPATAQRRDGQHDFDFDIGAWETHLRRLMHPLTGSTTWVEYQGTTVVRKVWNGRANLAELEADGPSGHLQVLSLRLYNPESHQWSLNSANVKNGTISVPTVGEFKNDRGEFYDWEELNGRMLLVRNVWKDISANSCTFEQAFSDDGGKTWEVNWVAVDTRIPGQKLD